MNNNNNSTHSLSLRKKLWFSFIIVSLFVIVFFCLAEVILRKSFSPWDVKHPAIINIEPAGSYFMKHPSLGFTAKPGRFKVTLAGPYSFWTTYLPNGLRITHPLNTYPAKTRKNIWIFGCSFTQGGALNDEQTYPWLLQNKLKDYEVVNYGGAAYSTLQNLIQFRDSLEKENKPELVILAYASFHDMRNTGTRAWMKALITNGGPLVDGLNLPSVRLSGNNQLELVYVPLVYHTVPFARYSALANYLDDLYNSLLIDGYRDHEISRVLIENISYYCSIKGIKFVLAGICPDYATAEMLEYFNRKGTMAVDISVDLSIKENNNLPYDNHPSAIANEQYERKLEAYLCGMKLISGPPCTH